MANVQLVFAQTDLHDTSPDCTTETVAATFEGSNASRPELEEWIFDRVASQADRPAIAPVPSSPNPKTAEI